METRIRPQHCNDCSWLFSKMGACPHPDVSMFFSYMSLIPYFIIFYLITLTLIKRKLSLIRLTSMLISAYIIGDKLLKNVFKSHRPLFSCKNTYGMPSSHMTVIAAVTFYIIAQKNFSISKLFGMICLCILQGIARVQLHYHTYEQVFAGAVFGIIYGYLFFKLFDIIWLKIKHLVPSWIGVQEDEFVTLKPQN